MNYVILVGLALFFIALSVQNGTSEFIFNDGEMNVRVVTEAYTLRISADGDVDLAPDASGVAALSSGGSLDVSLRQRNTNRRALYTSNDSSIRKQFFVEGNEQPWGPDAELFVAEVMPLVLRETALNADERVAWLLQNRGEAGLLEEIDLISSDYAQRVYTVRYAETSEIAASDFQRLMKMVADHMSSDFDVRTTLSAVYDARLPTGESFSALLDAGKTMSSDFDARTLLEHVGPRMPDTPDAATAYLDLAATISSDFDMRLALQPLVTRATVADEAVARALELAGSALSSDFDLRTLLTESAARVGASDELARAFTAAAGSISSDFDQREALTALAHDAALSPAGWQMLLQAAQSISSDFDAATLLTAVAAQMPQHDAVVEAYREALDTINNDVDQARAAGALETARR